MKLYVWSGESVCPAAISGAAIVVFASDLDHARALLDARLASFRAALDAWNCRLAQHWNMQRRVPANGMTPREFWQSPAGAELNRIRPAFDSICRMNYSMPPTELDIDVPTIVAVQDGGLEENEKVT